MESTATRSRSDSSESARWPRQYIAAVTGSLSEVVMGLVYGWPSAELPILTDRKEWPWPLTNDEVSWVVSVVDIGSLVASIPAGLAADRFGRKAVLLSSAVFFLVSWVLILTAQSVWWLYAARTLAGMGGGIVFTVNTLYWSEIASPAFRGCASALTQATLFLGVLLVNAFSHYMQYLSLGVFGIAVTLTFVFTFMFMPESPYFLLMRGQRERAARSLELLWGLKDVQAELQPLEEAVQAEMSSRSTWYDCGCSDLMRASRGTLRGLAIAVSLGALQRLVGLSAIIAYSSTTLPDEYSGIGPLLIAVVLFLASFGPLWLMDRLGRRPLLFMSAVTIAGSCLVTGVFYQLKQSHVDVSAFQWLPMTALIIYAMGYSMGFGPVPDIVPGEVFSSNVKGLAVPTVNVSLILFTFAVSKLYQVVGDSVGVQYMFWLFALVATVTALFAALLMPETRGKTLAEVHAELEGSSRRQPSVPKQEATL